MTPWVRSRNSHGTARRKDKSQSPFRSFHVDNRRAGALQIIARREAEVVEIERLLLIESDPQVQRQLTERLFATTNNLASWQGYLMASCYREPDAVVIPEGR